MSKEFDEYYHKHKVIPSFPTKAKILKYTKTKKFKSDDMYFSNANTVNEASHESSDMSE
jgi:hypothetical protein